jgi:hypothetical protein
MMVPGFNTDIKHRGETYHAQTEDNGVGNPVVVTLLYHKGAILASRKTSYRDLLDTPGLTEKLKELMKAQHKAVMRELLAGAYDRKISTSATPLPATAAVTSQTPGAAEAPFDEAAAHGQEIRAGRTAH